MIRPSVLTLCVPLIETFEKGPAGSFAATAYIDLAGNWTIGWGHKLTVNDPLLHATITADQAAGLRGQDLTKQDAYLNICLGDGVWNGLLDGQQAALIDWCFNLGIGAFERSALHHFVAEKRFNMVPGEIRKWVNAGKPPKPQGGLIKRRNAEVALWVAPPPAVEAQAVA